MKYFMDCIRNKYADFSGRARRSEYWFFYLFAVLFGIAAGIVDGILSSILGFGGIIAGLYYLAILIPMLAVTVRRLHDTGRDWFWIFVSLIPLVGSIIMLVFLVSDSQPGDNKFGPNPKGA